MRHRLITASAVALVIAANCARASATEENPQPQASAPLGSARLVQPATAARSPETTGALSPTQGATDAARVDSDARRVTSSVGRTLERMEQMFRTAVP